MSNQSINNALVMSQVKGNLVKEPTGPHKSQSGKEYMRATIACNNINRNAKDTWYPTIFFFQECMAFAKDLKTGDFIDITRALLNPGELQELWKDKSGKLRPQNSALMVMPVRSDNGITIPVKMIKEKNKTEETPKVSSKEAPKQQELPITATAEETEAEIVATIVA